MAHKYAKDITPGDTVRHKGKLVMVEVVETLLSGVVTLYLSNGHAWTIQSTALVNVENNGPLDGLWDEVWTDENAH